MKRAATRAAVDPLREARALTLQPLRAAGLRPGLTGLAWLLAGALPILSGPALAEGAARPSMKLPAGNARCLVCHDPPLFPIDAYRTSAHRKSECIECHDGYDAKGHADEPPEQDEAAVALEESYAKVSRVPKALVVCADCHEEVVEEFGGSVHAAWTKPAKGEAKEGTKPVPVTCLSCHGDSHEMQRIATAPIEARRQANAACVGCHSGEAMMKGESHAGEHHSGSYPDSLHGRLVALGNPRAPGCVDCHGSHGIKAGDDPASTVAAAAKVKTCTKCHDKATPEFADAFSHREPSDEFQPVVMWVHRGFSWLTALTLTGLFLHVVLDFGAQLRSIFRRRRKGAAAAHEKPALKGKVVRFDLHQRIQHWLMLVSVTVLAWTGWPIRAAVVGPSSHALVAMFGGVEGAALVHRIAAAVMAVSAVYHLGYLTVLAVRRRLIPTMFPTPRDIRDVFVNLAYLVGLRSEPPKFDRFSYAEKFDYWAVFWGVAIMGGTGLVRWFPVWFGGYLPGWALRSAEVAHGEEATLASLALFVWHFYNVHLRPSVFPMNWTWLSGKVSLESLREEHGLEYERRFPDAGVHGVPAMEPAPAGPAGSPAPELAVAPEPPEGKGET